MATRPLTDAQLDEALRLLAVHGSMVAAARAINMPRATFEGRIREARRRDLHRAIAAEARAVAVGAV